MSKFLQSSILTCLGLSLITSPLSAGEWKISSQADWEAAKGQADKFEVTEGFVKPKAEEAVFSSKIKTFDKKTSFKTITFRQCDTWLNWTGVPNVGPPSSDAPVMLAVGDKDYWFFARFKGGKARAPKKKGKKGKQPAKAPAKKKDSSAKVSGSVVPTQEPATLEGYSEKLFKTNNPNVFMSEASFDENGKVKSGGYHAWHSKDMKTWVHFGPATPPRGKWTTSAEYHDGKFYIYYDFPNDQDPHVIVDSNLRDGELGDDKGKAVADPSHGSDSAVIRSLDGKFHVIFEDWSPINASKRSWDSPLAGRAQSDDGVTGFKIMNPPVDERTKPTGKFAEYRHPHWVKEDPANYKSSMAKYEIHEPEQEAYGDWAAIAIGGQYYLFADYDPAGAHKMSVGWFTSDSLETQFKWCGHIGNGHPDPDIGFAEGKFWLLTQQGTDYISSGPWVPGVTARAGVDTDNDGKIDEWTDWQEVSESYGHIEGFARQISRTPASLDLSKLPAGHGIQFEYKVAKVEGVREGIQPVMQAVTVAFN